MDTRKKVRELPSIDRIIGSPSLSPLVESHSRGRVLDTLRKLLEVYRKEILHGKVVALSEDAIAKEVSAIILHEDLPSLKKVINATGTVIHTNLGRSVLPHEAVEAIKLAALNPVNLEYDLQKGKRGERDSHLERLICQLTEAEAATVVNNNAGAVFLVLNTLAGRKDVIVSRGELVEIGGSFRMPDIIRASGCRMLEVGTTNRTRIGDYENAISPKTGCLLKVHASNYRITGFAQSVPLTELACRGRQASIPVVEDLGSGALIDLSKYGLPTEPIVRERIEAGADIVTFSGDKLLGGPQAGIIAGKRELVKRINRNPLKRVLRVDKLTIAALEALLKLYLNMETLQEKLPVLRYLTRPIGELDRMAVDAAKKLSEIFGGEASIEVADGYSEIGSGSLPGESIPTKVISVRHKRLSPMKLSEIFRKSGSPIIGRIKDGRFLLDLRCVERVEDILPTNLT